MPFSNTCPYCHKPAGWFAKHHAECHERAQRGRTSLPNEIFHGVTRGQNVKELRRQAERVAGFSNISAIELERIAATAWNAVLESYLTEGFVSAHRRQMLAEAARDLKLSHETLVGLQVKLRLQMADVLSALDQGQLPSLTFQMNQHFPFPLQSLERVIWIAENVPFYEEKTRRDRYSVGGSVSMRGSKGSGTFYRVGGSHSYTVETNVMQEQDLGILAFTTHHLLFAGQRKNVKLPYSKMVFCPPYTDALVVMRATQTARPMAFHIEYGWFYQNLTRMLAHRAVF